MEDKITISSALCDLLALCMEISKTTDKDMFFEYSPHVNTFSVHFLLDDLKSGRTLIYLTNVEGNEITFRNIKECRDKLLKYLPKPITKSGKIIEDKITISNALCDLLALSMEISKTTDIDVSFHYSPHVNYFSVYVYLGGWESGKTPIYLTDFTHNEITFSNITRCRDKLLKYRYVR